MKLTFRTIGNDKRTHLRECDVSGAHQRDLITRDVYLNGKSYIAGAIHLRARMGWPRKWRRALSYANIFRWLLKRLQQTKRFASCKCAHRLPIQPSVIISPPANGRTIKVWKLKGNVIREFANCRRPRQPCWETCCFLHAKPVWVWVCSPRRKQGSSGSDFSSFRVGSRQPVLKTG